MKTIHELNRQIWNERINQNIDAALSLFSEIKLSLGLNNSSRFYTLKMINKKMILSAEAQNAPQNYNSFIFNNNETVFCELLALESSIARAQRAQDVSTEALKKIETEISYAISNISFLYQFEKAITYFTDGKWIEAVHHFLKAKNLCVTPVEKASCLLNLILCSEYLDIGYQNSLTEIQSLLTDLDPEFKRGMEEQLNSLMLREKWRNDSLVPADFDISKSSGLNQAVYFTSYLSHLPQYSQKYCLQPDANVISGKPGHLFNKDFRIRTLTFKYAPNDRNEGRLIDHIERLFLWTSVWISAPSSHSTQLLALCMQSFPWSQIDKLDTLSPDFKSMLLLSIGHLSLYDSSLTSLFDSLQKRLPFSAANRFLISEYEKLNSIRQALNSKSDLKVRQNQRAVFENEIQTDKMTKCILIDMNKYEIFVNDKCIRSKSLCHAISALTAQSEMAVDVFWGRVFQGRSYDHFLNANQVSNIIYKLNQICKDVLTIKQKDGRIYLQTLNQNSIKIEKADSRSEHLAASLAWTEFIQTFKTKTLFAETGKTFSKNRMILQLQNQFTSFTRSELQDFFSLSKPNANRILIAWLRENKIFKKGFGKNTAYYFSSSQKRNVS